MAIKYLPSAILAACFSSSSVEEVCVVVRGSTGGCLVADVSMMVCISMLQKCNGYTGYLRVFAEGISINRGKRCWSMDRPTFLQHLQQDCMIMHKSKYPSMIILLSVLCHSHLGGFSFQFPFPSFISCNEVEKAKERARKSEDRAIAKRSSPSLLFSNT